MPDTDPNSPENLRDDLDRNTRDLDQAVKDIEILKRENAELRALLGTLAEAVEAMPGFLSYQPNTPGKVQETRGRFGKAIQDVKAGTKPH